MNKAESYLPIVHVKWHGKLTFVSDLHGKPGVLSRIFEERNLESGLLCGDDMLVILGDNVDRGLHEHRSGEQQQLGVELLLDRLIYLKERFPEQVHVIMGNHELGHVKNISMNRLKAGDVSNGQNPLRLTPSRLRFIRSLPLGLILKKSGRSIFASHSGIPTTLDMKLHRVKQSEKLESIIHHKWIKELTLSEPYWLRKCGYSFTRKQLVNFLKLNHLDGFVRGHRQRNVTDHLDNRRFFMCLHSTSGDSKVEKAGQKIIYAVWDDQMIPEFRITAL